MLTTISKYDAWRTREPEDVSPLIERVDEDLQRGDHDADLQAALEDAGHVGVEELCDAIRRGAAQLREIDERRQIGKGRNVWELALRNTMLDTPTGQKFRERLIAEAYEKGA